MTKEQLAKLGITTEKDTLTDDEVIALLEPHIKGKDEPSGEPDSDAGAGGDGA